jgi:uncharacterized protein YecE (DUF72 family)
MPTLRIGMSGWTYAPWRGTFYPEDLTQKQELYYASRQVNSIEINGSFYSLQTPKSYEGWYGATPGDFVFSVKGGRYITHMRRLREIETPLATFFASGILALKEKLGPVLWQFPPNMKFDAGKFEAFFKLLPRDMEGAAELARKHRGKMKARAYLKVEENRPIRHAVEIRHASFEDEAFLALLREYNVAIVVADTAGKWPLIEEVTADFVYVRLHGDEQLYVSGYSDAALKHWAAKLRKWTRGRKGVDGFVYFDNDVKVRAPHDARALAKMMGVGVGADVKAKREDAGDEQPRAKWPAVARKRLK